MSDTVVIQKHTKHLANTYKYERGKNEESEAQPSNYSNIQKLGLSSDDVEGKVDSSNGRLGRALFLLEGVVLGDGIF